MIRIVQAEFIKSAVKLADYPETVLSEFAFVGRSNVGKSSMINTVLNRKALAKTSSTPGKTRLINFFEARCKHNETDEFRFILVDLPGFGYAKVSKTEQQSWQTMINTYLEKRPQLRCIYMLVDLRHAADKKDISMSSYLHSINIPFRIIGTKADKLPKSKISAQVRALCKDFQISVDRFIAFSCVTKIGLEAILESIESTLFAETGRVIIHSIDDTELINKE